MNSQDAFERILAALYDARLDDTRWPATSALIDEACGLTGNGLPVETALLATAIYLGRGETLSFSQPVLYSGCRPA